MGPFLLLLLLIVNIISCCCFVLEPHSIVLLLLSFHCDTRKEWNWNKPAGGIRVANKISSQKQELSLFFALKNPLSHYYAPDS
jgi:hypothetical protein